MSSVWLSSCVWSRVLQQVWKAANLDRATAATISTTTVSAATAATSTVSTATTARPDSTISATVSTTAVPAARTAKEKDKRVAYGVFGFDSPGSHNRRNSRGYWQRYASNHTLSIIRYRISNQSIWDCWLAIFRKLYGSVIWRSVCIEIS